MDHTQMTIETPPDVMHAPEELERRRAELNAGLDLPRWSLAVGFIEAPRRELPLASKQSMRRKRLKTRLEKKYPLFADQFYEEALAEKPEYYGVATATAEGSVADG
jgi:hypothetical protein